MFEKDYYQNQGSVHVQKKSVPGYARLLKNITKVGSRLRSVTQNVTKVGSRLRTVIQKRN